MGQICLEDPNRPCYGLEKARELEFRFQEAEAKNSDSHREIYERIRRLEIDQAEVKTEYGHIMETLGAIKADVADLKSKPARRWDGVVDKGIAALVGAFAAYLLSGGHF